MGFLFALLALQVSSIDMTALMTPRTEECAAPGADDAVVCGRRGRSERYRLPDRDKTFDPRGNVKSVMRERMSWGEGGDTGIHSCGPVGPGGYTGCLIKQWNRNDQQNPRRR